jgi:DNA-binding CsgD family transcriptional regulator
MADLSRGAGDQELSPREVDVLRLLASGHATKQIAVVLNIAIKTVSSHRMRIMDKLNVHDVAGLTRYAIQKGLIDIDGQPVNDEPLEKIRTALELAHSEYMQAVDAYRAFLLEERGLGSASSDNIAVAARLHEAEMLAAQKYSAALQELGDFVTGRRKAGDAARENSSTRD